MVIYVKQVEFFAQLAVVTLFGFFQHGQVLLQIVLAGPGCAVNALQHFIAVVTAPVGACHLHELEEFELAGAGHMRAAAQVFKSAFAVQRDIFTGRNAADDLGLVVLADRLEMGNSIIARQHAAQHGLVLGGELGHALFNCFQVFGRERPLVREVVEKAVFDHRADGHLRFREKLLDGVGQQMGSGVPDQLQALGILGSDDGQGAVAFNQVAGVHQLAVHFAAQGRLGQARTNGGSDFCHGDRLRKIAFGSVWKRDLNHGFNKEKEKARTGRAFWEVSRNGVILRRPCCTQFQWNCSSSVEPVRAVTLDLPPWIAVVTSSK